MQEREAGQDVGGEVAGRCQRREHCRHADENGRLLAPIAAPTSAVWKLASSTISAPIDKRSS